MYQFNPDSLSSGLFVEGGESSGLFAKGSTGAAPDTVYAVALCRGDMNTSDCRDCVDAAFKGAKQLCGLSKDATIFYDKCHLRFSNKDILNMDSANRVNTSGVVDGALVLMNMSSEPMLPGWDPNRQATNITKFFETVLNNMAGNLISLTAQALRHNPYGHGWCSVLLLGAVRARPDRRYLLWLPE